MSTRYPAELETEIEHRGQRLRLRPMRPDDAELISMASRQLAPEDLRMRFFLPIPAISRERAAALAALDYDRNMAFLLFDGEELLGVVRLAIEADREQGEFAVIVASDRHRQGIGSLLIEHILGYARSRGLKRVFGTVLRENTGMLALVERLGFARNPGGSSGLDVRVIKDLPPL
jgi:acetyltransferase